MFLLLARQQPIATDLRFLVTVMRVGHELERSADLMVNVAKTTRRLYPHQLDPKLRGIIDQMGTQAANQTRVAIDAFADSDPHWAAALADMDDRDGRAHEEPVPPHPRGRRCRRSRQCCSRCRWRWWAVTTSGSPTTR